MSDHCASQSLLLDLLPCSWLLWLTNCSKVSSHNSYTWVQARSPHRSSTFYSPSAACSGREIKEKGSFYSWKTNGLHSGLKKLTWNIITETGKNLVECKALPCVFTMRKQSLCCQFTQSFQPHTYMLSICTQDICLLPVQCFWPLKCLHARDWKTRRWKKHSVTKLTAFTVKYINWLGLVQTLRLYMLGFCLVKIKHNPYNY